MLPYASQCSLLTWKCLLSHELLPIALAAFSCSRTMIPVILLQCNVASRIKKRSQSSNFCEKTPERALVASLIQSFLVGRFVDQPVGSLVVQRSSSLSYSSVTRFCARVAASPSSSSSAFDANCKPVNTGVGIIT